MCGQFLMVPKEVVEQIIQDIIRGRTAKVVQDWPAQKKSVFPKAQVPVIVPDGDTLKAEEMTWGYEVSWNKGVIFNTRFDTALKPGNNMWADSLAQRRCIVPTFGFYEPHQSETFINTRSGKENKQKYFFSEPSSPVLYIAGIYEKDSFSLMTTEPNAAVRPIHNRMPVVLEPGELDIWLYGDYLSLADRSPIDLAVTKA